jgi:hypothetical protein
MGIDITYMDYDPDMAEESMMSLMHNMGDLQYLGNWGRCWFDLGTSDLMAIDILINALRQINSEYVSIKQLIIGGENEDWKVDDQSESKFVLRDEYS